MKQKQAYLAQQAQQGQQQQQYANTNGVNGMYSHSVTEVHAHVDARSSPNYLSHGYISNASPFRNTASGFRRPSWGRIAEDAS